MRSILGFAVLIFSLPALAQQTPVVPALTPTPAIAPAPMVLLEGTPISLKLNETVSSANAKVGQHVSFLVIEDVKLHGATIVPIGADAIGTVTTSEPKKWAGRAGKLDINIDSVRIPSGQKVLLSATPGGKGNGHGAAVTAGVIGTSLIFFPAAPFLLMIHGKDMVLPEGTPVKAFVSGDTTLATVVAAGN